MFAGLLASALAEQAEQEPRFVLGFALLFVAFETLFFGLLAIAANWLLDALNWGAIAGANLIAALAVGAYLWREHPNLRAQLRDNHIIRTSTTTIATTSTTNTLDRTSTTAAVKPSRLE